MTKRRTWFSSRHFFLYIYLKHSVVKQSSIKKQKSRGGDWNSRFDCPESGNLPLSQNKRTSYYFSLRSTAKIGYTRKPDGQNRVPPCVLVPGRHLIGQRPPRPDSGRISSGSTRFWLLTPPLATRFQSRVPDYGRVICTLFIF